MSQNIIDEKEEIAFIQTRMMWLRKSVIKKILRFYTEQNIYWEDPIPTSHIDEMADKFNIPTAVLEELWEHQLDFLDSKGIVIDVDVPEVLGG